MKLFKAYNKHLKGEEDFSGNIRGVCPLRLITDTLYKNRFSGMPAYIVGKGPSFNYINPSYFESWTTPIICVNQTIIPISRMGLPNPLFFIAADRPDDYYLDQATNLDGILKVFPHIVAHDYKRYRNVYVLEAAVIKHLSSCFAVELAYYLGCEMIDFIAFDAFFGLPGYADCFEQEPTLKHLENVASIRKQIKSPYTVTLPRVIIQ